MKNKTKFLTIASALSLVLMSQVDAATAIEFSNLSTELDATNDISASGGGTVSSTGLDTGSTFTYSVTYSGFDFDGDAANDSFSFDVIVAGVNGSTRSNTGLGTSSVSLGTNSQAVGIIAQGGGGNSDSVWVLSSGTASRFDPGETLIFSVGNFQSTNTDSDFVLDIGFDGFIGGRVSDRAGNGVPSGIFGIGTELNGYTNNAGFNGVIAAGAQSVLHITSTSVSGSNSNVGVSNVDFGFTVDAIAVPEPSAYALLAGLTGLAFVMVRRRRA